VPIGKMLVMKAIFLASGISERILFQFRKEEFILKNHIESGWV
jgi:hypothetical protein